MKNNKIICILIFLILFYSPLRGQDKTFILAENCLPYSSQTWFYCGIGNAMDGNKIKQNWDEGRRITSAAYTSNGWFVTMSKDTGIGMQTYNSVWDSDWVMQKWNEGYRISSLSYGNNSAFVVMSQDTGIGMQTYNSGAWTTLQTWIKENWDKNYYITDAAYNGVYWQIVMSQTPKISAQGYLWATTYEQLKSKIQEQVWDKGYNVQLIEFGQGEYLAVYCKYANNNGRIQSWNEFNGNVSNFIQNQWDNSRSIAYIGGGYANTNNAIAYAPTPVQQPQQPQPYSRQYGDIPLAPLCPMDGDIYFEGYIGQIYTRHWSHPDGSCDIQQDIPCHSCTLLRGKCNICNGTGNAYYMIGRFMLCPACGGSKNCSTCGGDGIVQTPPSHWEKGQAEAYLKAHREVERGARRNSPSSSYSSCSVCGGSGFKKERYSAAASSASGWMPPHHNYGGNTCTICSHTSDHYHYPCSECHGYGHVRN